MSEPRSLLKSARFPELFNALGWDHHATPLEFPIGGQRWRLAPVAEKRGVQVFHVIPSADGGIPPYDVRKKIDAGVTLRAVEHLLIYTDAAKSEQIWQWVSRPPGKPRAYREYRFRAEQTGDAILQKLEGISFTLDEEESLTLRAVTEKLKDQFDRQTVTKNFYREFSTEREKFRDFIEGITALADREWYASLMLNRLMFVYFIQAKRFLDNNDNYLAEKLREVRAAAGANQFHNFYRRFLIRLFHHGLGLPENARRRDHPDLDALLGKIPYLNGGLFQEHEIERSYGDKIKIPDKAFERIFAFFGKWHWYLDERPIAEGNEINPDVLGYIFEQYINQKQMGAYYTKEDITGYIAKNTIVPFVLDAARERCRVAFEGTPSVWRHLAEQPERYLYPAVKHGLAEPLPKDIAAGLDDVSKRDRWNTAAPRTHALPTETWRELIARHRRCKDILAKLKAGEVRTTADLITLNLDIRQFAQDLIQNCDGPELLRALWEALAGDGEKRLPLSVLDPTCGSGAFLFAALDVLSDLYRACLDRMAAFVGDAKAAGKTIVVNSALGEFQKVLDDLAKHPSADYFILKSIIVRNLYGVDLMREAVEICKLRLFLKLASQVEKNDRRDNMGLEPLPDIDFNIRAGNTLVGYATRDEVHRAMSEFQGSGQMRLGVDDELAAFENFSRRCADTEQAFAAFSEWTLKGDAPPAEHKAHLREKLAVLEGELNRFLAKDYGVNPEKKKAFEDWLDSHQPFHWFVEFYGIMQHGGFDVVIGNPPYIAMSKVRQNYVVRGFKTDECSDIYAVVMERSARLLRDNGCSGMIVPLSLTFSGDFDALRQFLRAEYGTNWFSSYGRIPAALFNADVRVRNTIHIGHRSREARGQFTTRIHRWFEEARPQLLASLEYAPFAWQSWRGLIPKLNSARMTQAFETLFAQTKVTVAAGFAPSATKHILHFKKTAYNWLNFCRELPPCFDARNKAIPHTKFGAVSFPTSDTRDIALALLNGKLVLAFWFAIGDDFDLTKWMFADFPFDFTKLSPATRAKLVRLAEELDEAMNKAVSFKLNAGKRVGNFNLARCRHVTDRSDRIFAEALGITDAWEEFELLYRAVVKTDFTDSDDE